MPKKSKHINRIPPEAAEIYSIEFLEQFKLMIEASGKPFPENDPFEIIKLLETYVLELGLTDTMSDVEKYFSITMIFAYCVKEYFNGYFCRVNVDEHKKEFAIMIEPGKFVLPFFATEFFFTYKNEELLSNNLQEIINALAKGESLNNILIGCQE